MSDTIRFADQSLVVGDVCWERALVDASMVMDRNVAEAYALRVGRETVGMAIDALKTARNLAIYGLVDYVEATAKCLKCPLKMALHKSRAVGITWVDSDRPGCFHTVGHDVVDALAASSWQTEIRTPPEVWRSAPPMQLFEEGP